MKFEKTPLQGLYVIELEPYKDKRGTFTRVYCEKELEEIDFEDRIVQINHSLTKEKGSIRGMHFQHPPMAEIKFVKCVSGRIYDVAIDLRKNSQTYLDWFSQILSEDNQKLMYIPEGFAHGFQTLENNCEILYLHSQFYDKDLESGIRYNDPQIGIEWPLPITKISERDKTHKLLDNKFKGIEL